MGLGTLALTQAYWPRREPLIPSLAAKSSPRQRMLTSLPSCLAPGTALSERKALISTVSSGAERDQLPVSGSSAGLCSPGLCEESPFPPHRASGHPRGCVCGSAGRGLRLDGSWSPGMGALQKVPRSPQLVPATFQRGNLQQWGSPWDGVGTASPTSSVQGLIGHNRRLFPAPAPSPFPQRAKPREVFPLADLWRGRLGLEKLAWKISTGG